MFFDPTLSATFDELSVVYDALPEGSAYRYSHFTGLGGAKSLRFDDYDPLFEPPAAGGHAVRFPAGEAVYFSGSAGFEGVRNGHASYDKFQLNSSPALPADVHVGPGMVADIPSLGPQSADGSFEAQVGAGSIGDVLVGYVSYSDPADPNMLLLYWGVFAPPSSGAQNLRFPKMPPSLGEIDPEGLGWQTNGEWLQHTDVESANGYAEVLSKGTALFSICGPGCSMRYVSGWGL